MARGLKILFIFKAGNYFVAPLGPMIISALAAKQGCETALCQLGKEDPLEQIGRQKPDIIAYSSSTGEAKHYIKINQAIKERFPDIFSIMGGPHPTFYPDLVKETTLDAICVGEGEGAVADLIDRFSSGKSIEGIPNVLTPGKTACSVRNLVENLDSLPFPDYGLFFDKTEMGKSTLKSFMTSRGCPYNCSYCFNACWNRIYQGRGKVVRRHSVDWVIEDIKRVKERWPLSTVKFYDDIFCYRADGWLEEFSRKYKKHIDLPFFILTRCDLLTEDMVKLLKYAGCRTISMSIEAGNPRIRNEMLNRRMSDEQIIVAHRLCQKYDIHTFANCILGLPGTSIENELESVDLATRCRVDWAEFPIFYPYPGTELGDQAVNMGMYTPDYNQMHTSYMYRSPLSCFSEREKDIHINLTSLASLAVMFPRLRNLIMRRLIYWRPNLFFILLYYLIKMYVIRRKIYVTRTNFWQSLLIYLRTLKQEIFRRSEEEG